MARPSAVADERPATTTTTTTTREAGDRLIAAGRALMQDRRSTDFTMQAVAERARTSLRTVYEQFASRDDFLLAVFRQAIAESAEPLRAAVARAGDGPARLRAYVEQLFDATFAEEHPEMPALVALHMDLARTNPSALAGVLAPQQEILVDVLRGGVADGSFRDDVDVTALAMLVSLTVIGALHSTALGTHFGSEVDAERVVRFCLGAVARPDGDRVGRAH